MLTIKTCLLAAAALCIFAPLDSATTSVAAVRTSHASLQSKLHHRQHQHQHHHRQQHHHRHHHRHHEREQTTQLEEELLQQAEELEQTLQQFEERLGLEDDNMFHIWDAPETEEQGQEQEPEQLVFADANAHVDDSDSQDIGDSENEAQDVDPAVADLFKQWQTINNKQYASASEEAQRLAIFAENVASTGQTVADLLASLTRAPRTSNKKGLTASSASSAAVGPSNPLGLSPFSDLSPEEFKRTHLGYAPSATAQMANVNSAWDEEDDAAPLSAKKPASLPKKFTWVGKGPVSPIKDQGNCGSCWAYSSTEAVESAVYMKTKTLPILSPQQVISCDSVDAGCNGGDTLTAYNYIQQNGLESAADYPDSSATTALNGTCTYNANAATTKITGFQYATPPCTSGACVGTQDEETLAQSLMTYGPVSVCLTASPWQNYKGHGSIMTSKHCGSAVDTMDHCVQLVGWNTRKGSKYWILKNQWGSTWGNHGYIYLKYGENTCGMANEATIVNV